ncbi:hypothetical protein D3C73_1204390 [compost metagenome]
MDDVCSFGCQQHFFVGLGRVTFGRADKPSAKVGQIRAEQLRGKNFMSVVQAAGQQQGLVEELADFGNQRERAPGPGVSTGPGSHGDQSIHAGFGRFFGMTTCRHVMEHQAAVAVHRIDQFFHGAEAGDHDRHFVLYTDLQVRL